LSTATERNRNWAIWALLGPGLVFIAGLLLVPIIDMTVISFRGESFAAANVSGHLASRARG